MKTGSMIEDGYAIRGNDGVDIFAYPNGYFVEHFSLMINDTHATLCRIGPFKTRDYATTVLRDYVRVWGNGL